jgi:hypothetical protein
MKTLGLGLAASTAGYCTGLIVGAVLVRAFNGYRSIVEDTPVTDRPGQGSRLTPAPARLQPSSRRPGTEG